MTTHRFFLPTECIQGDAVRLPDPVTHQIRRVLRMREGERIVVLDGSGKEFTVRLKGGCGGIIEGVSLNLAEPRTRITLYQGLLKSARLEMLLQKCTEIGVYRFVPVLTKRSRVGDPGTARRQRFEQIVREAAEQSGRGIVPVIQETASLAQALRAAGLQGQIVIPWEEERGVSIQGVPLELDVEIGLFIGPEGGFTCEEIEEARELGARVVSLGPRILRAETAAMVASALLLARLEGMDATRSVPSVQ
ncbi:MAG: RsmE family RNA methyltransferase, partial [Chloroflexota bacterium]